jgi:hypothetical protein
LCTIIIGDMSKSYISVLQSLNTRIMHLESKALAMKLGTRTEAEEDARIELNVKMREIKDKYYIEKLDADDQSLLDGRFIREYGVKATESDDFVPAILTFVGSEAEKRIVGHLLREYEEYLMSQHGSY